MDFVDPARLLRMQFVGGRGHYDAVVRAVMDAQHSVWISTANLKELMVEDHRAVPGRSRTARSRPVYRSIFDSFDDLARRGVDLRILHAGQPSRAFRSQLARHRQLAAGALALRTCPRVHFKAVIVDGAQLYLGSANWTGAGLGAKGTGRRNFELGLLTRDDGLLDQVQRLYDEIWRGGPCKTCKLRPLCPKPLDLPLRPTQQ